MSNIEADPTHFAHVYGGGMLIPEPGAKLDGDELPTYVGLEFGRPLDPRLVHALNRLLGDEYEVVSSDSAMYITPSAHREELLSLGSLINQKTTEKRIREWQSNSSEDADACKVAA